MYKDFDLFEVLPASSVDIKDSLDNGENFINVLEKLIGCLKVKIIMFVWVVIHDKYIFNFILYKKTLNIMHDLACPVSVKLLNLFKLSIVIYD